RTQAMMNGANNPMLTWRLGQTEVHCTTCLELNGKKHKAQWYIDNDYIPRKPGANLECNGYNCDCDLVDSSGKVYTL
ncbi:MAG: hypothetical protein NUV80_07590, partial [Candidatus Berkelbacteria bacterium]|nr:hypothetical protein [Candidatus Berkelbacteria bacterium]